MTKKIIFTILILWVLGVGYLGYKQLTKPVHYHAGFVVFVDGKKVDFSDNKYMYLKPCAVKGKEIEGDPQIEKAHLHDNVPDVVHIEFKGAKWGDLFTNIKYEIDYSKVNAFINSQKITDLKNTPIKPYDSLLVFVGTESAGLLNQSVTKDRIIEIEKSSGSCSD